MTRLESGTWISVAIVLFIILLFKCELLARLEGTTPKERIS